MKNSSNCRLPPVFPIPAVPGHPADPVVAFHHLISASPSSSPDHLLLSYQHGGHQVVVTIPMLASAFSSMVGVLDLNPTLGSLHSLRRGGAIGAHRQGLHQQIIKPHGMWSSDSFWSYITSTGVASSPVATGLATMVQAVSFSSTSHSVIPCHTP